IEIFGTDASSSPPALDTRIRTHPASERFRKKESASGHSLYGRSRMPSHAVRLMIFCSAETFTMDSIHLTRGPEDDDPPIDGKTWRQPDAKPLKMRVPTEKLRI